MAKEMESKVLSNPIDFGDGFPLSLSNFAAIFGPNPPVSKKDVLRGKITILKSQPDSVYGDQWNKLVCITLDQQLRNRLLQSGFGNEEITPDLLKGEEERLRSELNEIQTNGKPANLLRWAEQIATRQLETSLDSIDFQCLATRNRQKTISSLISEISDFSTNNFPEIQLDEENLKQFSTLWVIINTAQSYPFTDKRVRKEVLKNLGRSFFLDEDFVLCSLVCMSFVHQPKSEPGTIRITPGQIERRPGRDNDDIEALEKIAYTAEILRFFLGERVKIYAILSDVDFGEVFKVTDPSALAEAETYFYQYEDICNGLGLIPMSFSEILAGDFEAKMLFFESLADIRENIRQAYASPYLGNPRFYISPVQVDRLARSIYEYYNGLPGVAMTWEVAIQNTIDKLAVYGSQPSVLRKLFGNKFVFISGEAPVRDAMYQLRDKKTGQRRIPIIYPFTKLIGSLSN